MELARNVLLILHLAGMAGILISILGSRTKLSSGISHSALLALIAGIGLVGIRYSLNSADPAKWELIDNAKITIKLIFVIAILAITYVNKKKESLKSWVIPVIAGLTIGNIIIAYAW